MVRTSLSLFTVTALSFCWLLVIPNVHGFANANRLPIFINFFEDEPLVQDGFSSQSGKADPTSTAVVKAKVGTANFLLASESDDQKDAETVRSVETTKLVTSTLIDQRDGETKDVLLDQIPKMTAGNFIANSLTFPVKNATVETKSTLSQSKLLTDHSEIVTETKLSTTKASATDLNTDEQFKSDSLTTKVPDNEMYINPAEKGARLSTLCFALIADLMESLMQTMKILFDKPPTTATLPDIDNVDSPKNIVKRDLSLTEDDKEDTKTETTTQADHTYPEGSEPTEKINHQTNENHVTKRESNTNLPGEQASSEGGKQNLYYHINEQYATEREFNTNLPVQQNTNKDSTNKNSLTDKSLLGLPTGTENGFENDQDKMAEFIGDVLQKLVPFEETKSSSAKTGGETVKEGTFSQQVDLPLEIIKQSAEKSEITEKDVRSTAAPIDKKSSLALIIDDLVKKSKLLKEFPRLDEHNSQFGNSRLLNQQLDEEINSENSISLATILTMAGTFAIFACLSVIGVAVAYKLRLINIGRTRRGNMTPTSPRSSMA